MRRLTDISMGSVSTLLPVYPYYSVLVSDTFLLDATYRLSDTFLDEATGSCQFFQKTPVKQKINPNYFRYGKNKMAVGNTL